MLSGMMLRWGTVSVRSLGGMGLLGHGLGSVQGRNFHLVRLGGGLKIALLKGSPIQSKLIVESLGNTAISTNAMRWFSSDGDFHYLKSDPNRLKRNRAIKEKYLKLLNEDQTSFTIVSTEEAIEKAKQAGKDLVELTVAPARASKFTVATSETDTSDASADGENLKFARLMTYREFLDYKQQLTSKKKADKEKEIVFSSEIQENDIDLKLRKIEEFLNAGYNVTVKVELKKEIIRELKYSNYSIREFVEKEGAQRNVDDIAIISLPNYLQLRNAESHIVDTVLLSTHLLTIYLKRLLQLEDCNWIPAGGITTTDTSAAIMIRSVADKHKSKKIQAINKQKEKNELEIEKFAKTVRETREKERIATARSLGIRVDIKGGVGSPPVLPPLAESKRAAVKHLEVELEDIAPPQPDYDPYSETEENLENDKDMKKLNPPNKKGKQGGRR